MRMVAERQDTVVPFFDLGATLREQRDEFDAVWARIVDGSAFVGGAEVDRFECDWATACGTRFAIGVGNGTDAIAITLRALGIGHGDEVIVPTNTFVATVEAVVLAGATPRFVDVDARTLLVTPELVEAAIGPRTVAVIPVHLYGNVADVEGVCRVAARDGDRGDRRRGAGPRRDARGSARRLPRDRGDLQLLPREEPRRLRRWRGDRHGRSLARCPDPLDRGPRASGRATVSAPAGGHE